jgi:hypothetical protein
MARFIRRGAIAIPAAIVVVGAVLSAVVVTSCASQRLGARVARRVPPHTPAIITATPSRLGLGAASLQLAAPYATPDSPLRVMASGFRNSEPLAVTIVDTQGYVYEHLTLQADTGGGLRETPVVLPAGLGPGAYRLIMVGGTSHHSASATFQMDNIPPTVTLDAYAATPGQVISFAGSGFIPGEMVTVHLGASSAPLLHTTVTAGGAVSGHLTIPEISAGAYTLTLLGTISRMPASVGFNVQRFTPWVVLDRYTLAPGQREGFIAHGFEPGEQVFVYLNSLHGTPVLRVQADTTGQITMQDAWSPDGASGNDVLTFVGQLSKATTTVDFTVQATGQ